MIGFVMLFVAAVVAFALVIQGTYKKPPLFAKYPVLDEILGGVLGVCQGFLLLLFLTIILDQYFLNVPGRHDDELGFLRVVLGRAGRLRRPASFIHANVIPNFVACSRSSCPTTSRPRTASTAAWWPIRA